MSGKRKMGPVAPLFVKHDGVRPAGKRFRVLEPAWMAIGGKISQGPKREWKPIDWDQSKMQAYLRQERQRGVLRVTNPRACIEHGTLFMRQVLKPSDKRSENIHAHTAGNTIETACGYAIFFPRNFLIELGAMVLKGPSRPLIREHLEKLHTHYRQVFDKPIQEVVDAWETDRALKFATWRETKLCSD